MELDTRRFLQYAVVIALICAGAVWFSTAQQGIGFNTDSFAYIQGAKDLRADGLHSPSITLTKFPPLPALILLALDIRPMAFVWFHMLVMAGNVLALAYAFTLVEARAWIGLPVLLAVGLAPEIVFRHAMVMSEPVFLLLVQLALIATVRGRLGWAVLFAALAPMQRYAGIAIIATCVLYIALTQNWQRGVSFGVISIMPLFVWMVRGSAVGESTGREIAFHPITWTHIETAVITLAGRFWFAPAVGVVLVLLYMEGKTSVSRLALPSNIPPMVKIAALFIAIYGAFLLVSISFVDVFTPLDSRILSPVLLYGWLILGWLSSRLVEKLTLPQKRLWGLLAAVMITGFLAFGLLRLAQNHLYGVGLLRNIQPEYYDVIDALPDDKPVYTNDTAIPLVMLYMDEALTMPPLLEIPAKFNPINEIPNPDYEAQYNEMIDAIRSGELRLLWFVARTRHNTVSPEELKQILPYKEFNGLLVFG